MHGGLVRMGSGTVSRTFTGRVDTPETAGMFYGEKRGGGNTSIGVDLVLKDGNLHDSRKYELFYGNRTGNQRKFVEKSGRTHRD